ncbi:MAG: MATE family efflux transporter [Bacilli bacterium]|nr:MATE family efflux transporter [Bacilli bacterium]MDD4388905.1 MATE family efflux transporter [Bacilli bacterium]
MHGVRSAHRRKHLLESNNLYLSILILSLPIFLSNLMKALNSFIDMFFVSNLVADEIVADSITAISITFPIFSITQAIAYGVMAAGVALIAQSLGADRQDTATKITGQLLILTVILGVIMNIILYLITPTVVTWMGAKDIGRKLMIDYVRIRSFEMVPLFIYFAFHASRQASGDTLTPFIINMIMILFNIFMTWFLITQYDMGVKGAAIGTLLANVVIVPIFMVLLFHKNKNYIYLRRQDLVYDGVLINKIFKLSWPVAISQAFTSLGFLILNSIILSYGNSTVNAFQVGNKINSLVLNPSMGIGAVTATFVGQNVGANNEKRARAAVRAAMILVIIISVIGAMALMPFRRSLAGIFLKRVPETLELSVEYMFFVFTSLPLMGIYQVFMGAYQGSGETHFSLILATVRLWFMRIPLVLLYKNIMKLPTSSIWYAMMLSNFAMLYLGVILYCRCRFRPKIKEGEIAL